LGLPVHGSGHGDLDGGQPVSSSTFLFFSIENFDHRQEADAGAGSTAIIFRCGVTMYVLA